MDHPVHPCYQWTMQSNSEVLHHLPRDSRLAGRTAVVTGSTSGIGEAIARVLAASGATVVITGRDTARARAVVAAITAAGGDTQAVAADLAGGYAGVREFAGPPPPRSAGGWTSWSTTPGCTRCSRPRC